MMIMPFYFLPTSCSDGTVSTHENLPAELLHKNNAPVFLLGGKIYELSNKEGYRQFWAIYHSPPKAEYRNYLLERRDSLIPLDERSFKGAYYTPLAVVDKAYDKLTETLGKNWQTELHRVGYVLRRGQPGSEAQQPAQHLHEHPRPGRCGCDESHQNLRGMLHAFNTIT